MKIHKPGNIRLAKRMIEAPVTFKCLICKCEWTAVRGEYTNCSNQFDGEMYSCVCPCCKSDTWAYEKDKE